MSNTYKNTKDYAFQEHNEAFTILLDVFKTFAIRYFLIGAQARDVHFLSKDIKPVRGTRDIDFAVMVESQDQYKRLMEALIAKGFKKDLEPYRLIWSNDETIFDLLPFGQIEEDYTVNFDEREIEISVLGYAELNQELQEFYIDEDQSVSVPVSPLHGIFILKLLSWNDKKPGREKDLQDLSQILNTYWEFIEHEAYEKHQDLFDDNFEMGKAAARILGRHLKSTLNKSEILKQKIYEILKEQSTAVDPPGLMLQKFSQESDKPISTIKSLLDEILTGINE